ncbi:MAG: PAS domain S-box protein [Spirochaetaceae bacterium]
MTKKILLVEDEVVLALSQTRILEKYDFAVATAKSGEEALETLASDPSISLVLMDIDLGKGMDGTETAQKILENNDLPIVFLTSHSEKEYVDKVKGITRYGYVLKNSGEFVLIESINMAFELFEAHQRLKKNEIEARAVVDNIDSAVLRFNEKGEFIFFSKGAEKIFGYKEEEVIGLLGTETINPPVDSGGMDQQKMLEDIFADPERYSYNENETVRKDGTRLWMAWRNKAVYDEKGNRLFMQCIGYDITERKKNEERLQRALDEREYLLQELNHRVKNNLSMVSSLISLKDAETEDDLSDLRNRIDAIGLVHEKLNHSGELTRVEASEYLEELLSSIFSSLSYHGVDVHIEADTAYLEVSIIIPLGLIINEAATNALKHGFTREEKARFAVALRADKKSGRYTLSISNSGNPIPEGVEFSTSESMGLQLIKNLVEQIDGTLEIKRSPNPEFTIEFPMEVE